jgi:flagellar hook-associated protein 3 FlgL
VFGIQQAYARFDVAQRKVNTGKQLEKPSDNPSGTAQTLEFRERVSELDQFGRTISQAQNFISTSEAALDSVNSLTRQARTFGVQGASDSVSGDTRTALAGQIQNIISQIATIANTSYGSQYVFAGQRTDTAPIQGGPTGYTYVGGTTATNDADLTLDTGRNETIKINVTGDQVFIPLLAALGKLRDDVNYGATSIVSNTDLAQVDTQLTNVVAVRADLGSKVQRLQLTTQRNTVIKENYTKFISDIENADIPSSIVELQTAQTAYQAALQSTSRTFQNSLLDFIK